MKLIHGTVTYKKLQKYYSLGINRLSIGLQSTNNELLKSIGRIHTYEQFLETFRLARKVGFNNINVDLMLGLPNQTLQDLQNSLEEIVNLKPEHISVYSLILEEGTVLYNKVLNNEITLPTDIEERNMYWQVKAYLEKSNYEHYEISNFAIKSSISLSSNSETSSKVDIGTGKNNSSFKLNYRALHNTNCWEQKEYIGIGAGASSFLDEKRYTNSDLIEEYIENNMRIVEEVLNKKSKMQEYVMLGLRKIEGINIQEFKEEFDIDFFTEFKNQYNKLYNEGLLLLENGYVKLSKKGIDLANLVWEEFV